MERNDMAEHDIYSFEVQGIDGEATTLAPYKGKVMLIVNVASECGLTVQYKGLEELYRKYKDRGFTVLGFPCNQFAGQEPGDESQIKSFCEARFGVTFPLFAKVDVNGANSHPLYDFLKKAEPGFLGTEAIKWNFTKFLVDKNGQVTQRFSPQKLPEELAGEIEALL